MSNFLFHKDQEWDGFPLSIFIHSGGFTLLVAILILLVTNSFLESHFSVFPTVYMQAVDYSFTFIASFTSSRPLACFGPLLTVFQSSQLALQSSQSFLSM